jgi:hypothetical protein
MDINELYESMIPVNIELARVMEGISREECIDKVLSIITNRLDYCNDKCCTYEMRPITGYYKKVFPLFGASKAIDKNTYDFAITSLRCRMKSLYCKYERMKIGTLTIGRLTHSICNIWHDIDEINLNIFIFGNWYNNIDYSDDYAEKVLLKLLNENLI